MKKLILLLIILSSCSTPHSRSDAYSKILDMQLPEIIPFENTELEMKFQEVSGQIISEIQ